MSAKFTSAKPDPKLLTLLVCPLTGGQLQLSTKKTELISPIAKLAFPIRDGIPIMVASEARAMQASELKKSTRPKKHNS